MYERNLLFRRLGFGPNSFIVLDDINRNVKGWSGQFRSFR
jgi:hypothetical protein